jgi:hypothetical protein
MSTRREYRLISESVQENYKDFESLDGEADNVNRAVVDSGSKREDIEEGDATHKLFQGITTLNFGKSLCTRSVTAIHDFFIELKLIYGYL